MSCNKEGSFGNENNFIVEAVNNVVVLDQHQLILEDPELCELVAVPDVLFEFLDGEEDDRESVKTNIQYGTNNNNKNNVVEPNASQFDDETDYVPEANPLSEQQNQQTQAEISSDDLEAEKKKTFRKKKRCVKEWKCSERKRKRQAGEEYISSRKKVVPKKAIKTIKDCTRHCKYKCDTKVSNFERKQVFESYYGVDQNRKYDFIEKTTCRLEKGRKTKENSTKRTYTFKYYFVVNDEKVQVCKTFYLSTLNISQKVIYNVHLKKNTVTGLAQSDLRGTIGSRSLPEEQKQYVRDHINSFPCVESHYCRARTSKKYLDSNLNIAKMYEFYVQLCHETHKPPVKVSYYRFIFATEFNLDFHIPKTDRCGECAAYDILVKDGNEIMEDVKEKYKLHLKLKEAMREMKKVDKSSETPVVVFDMQNVITCPKTEIGPLFYKSKLNIYNLTAYLTTTKTTYCALWTENTSGRTGNDLACAFVNILTRIVQDNEIENIITWSDSCVPQNRNSIIAFAITNFLKENPNINSIEMKYSLAGHSACQEVDNCHSQIEKHLKPNEFFSPMGLIRLLKMVSRKNPFVIIQMQPSKDYKNFAECSKQFDYKNVPFSQLHMIRFTQECLYELEYSLEFNAKKYSRVSVKPTTKRMSRRAQDTHQPTLDLFSEIRPVNASGVIKVEKRAHLISMFAYMSHQDLQYYKVILNIGEDEFEEIMQKIKRDSGQAMEVKNKAEKTLAKEKKTKVKKMTVTKKPTVKGPKLSNALNLKRKNKK